jgi:hypothetical protein
MKIWHTRAAIGLAWLAMVFCLLRYEAYPEWFTSSLQGYRGILSRNLLVRDSWSRIMIGDRPAGYAYTSIDVDEASAEKFVLVDNRTHLRLSLLGSEQNMHLQTSLRLDGALALHDFNVRVATRLQTVTVHGERIEREQYRVVTTIGNHEQVSEVHIPGDAVLYSPVTEMSMRALRPGQSLVVKSLDPLTLATARITVTAEAQEEITVAGTTHAATRLRSDYRGVQFLSWVNAEGSVVRQETPLGWTIEACTAEQALAAVSGNTPAPGLRLTGGGGILRLLMGGREGL